MGGIIRNDDIHLISSKNIRVREGNEGIIYGAFSVSLSEPSSVPVQVEYLTANGTAEAGRDYQSRSGTLLFQPGETNKSIAVPVLGNFLHETDKTFYLLLHDPIQAGLMTNEAMATIENDDEDIPPLILDIQVTSQEISIQFETTPELRYSVEHSRILGTGGWTVINSVVAESEVTEVSNSIEKTDAQGFYHIVRSP